MVKRTTPRTKDVQIEEKLAQDFDFPFFKKDGFNDYMQKFMHSFKNIYSTNINASNVCFVTGPIKGGKSWFLRYNIRLFEQSKAVRSDFL